MSSCPPIESLEAALAGPGADARLLAHLETCSKCQKRAERIRENNVILGQLGGVAAPRLAAALVAPAAAPSPHESLRVDLIPGYEILSEISRGGQGVVYQGIQKSTRRKVALKVLKEGPFAGPRDRARFEREVRILSQLNHPNIVTILDSGAAHGSFYLVTQYISGQALDDYLAAQGGSKSKARTPPAVADTLRLFVKICEAVNTAHLRGVIHRDLKPDNIRIDHAGEPHILDFGLAKLTIGQVADESHARIMTRTGQFMGSLPWASPEQAEGAIEKIDLRTDVYSLGVLLYQALTGQFPYGVSGPLREAANNIVNTEPARPGSVRRGIDDEVETIVLKCLAKERERRYQSAGELARDLGRYLAGEPIEAKRESTWYVLKKTLRRHFAPLCVGLAFAILLTAAAFAVAATVAAAFVAVLTAGFVGVLVLWRQAIRQRNAAEVARREAEQAREAEAAQRRLTETNEAKAEAEAAKARAVNEFLQDMLALADPFKVHPVTRTVRDLLDEAARKLETDALRGQPEVAAAVHGTIGNAYGGLGEYGLAEPHLLRALAVQREQLGEAHPDTLLSINGLANLYILQGRYVETDALLTQALELANSALGEGHPDTLELMNNLADSLQRQGRLAEAEPLYMRTLALRRRALGDEHPETLHSLSDLATTLQDQGKVAEAEPLYAQALALHRRVLGEEHPQTLQLMKNMAILLQNQERLAEAEPLSLRVLEVQRRVLGAEHPKTLNSMNMLGLLYAKQNRHAEAETLLRQALGIQQRKLTADHPDIAATLASLGLCLLQQAQEDHRKGVEGPRDRGTEKEETDSPVPLASQLLDPLVSPARYAEAEAFLRESLRIRREKLPDHWVCFVTMSLLGTALAGQEKRAEAEPLLRESGEGACRNPQTPPDRRRQILQRLIDFYRTGGRMEEADDWQARWAGFFPPALGAASPAETPLHQHS